jgi:hypothetical protein
VHRALEQAGRKILILVLSGSIEHEVMQGAVERPDRGEPPRENDGGCNPPDCAEINIRLPHFKVGEGQAAIARAPDSTLTRNGGQGISRDAGVSVCPFQAQIQRIEKSGSGELPRDLGVCL